MGFVQAFSWVKVERTSERNQLRVAVSFSELWKGDGDGHFLLAVDKSHPKSALWSRLPVDLAKCRGRPFEIPGLGQDLSERPSHRQDGFGERRFV